jgi:hypothetical protein
MYSNVMLRFLAQALQDPPFCSSTDFSAEERLFRSEKFALEQKSHLFSVNIFYWNSRSELTACGTVEHSTEPA